MRKLAVKTRGFGKVSTYKGKQVTLPIRATAYSAGYDIFSNEKAMIPPSGQHIFRTGVKAYMQQDEHFAIHIRSSLAFKKHLRIMNCTGIIDSDYYNNPDNEGHILVGIKNEGPESVEIKRGDKIAQGIFLKYLLADGDQQQSVRSGGVGSSGK